MSKTSFIVGLGFSLIIHGAFLLTRDQRAQVRREPTMPEVKNVPKLIPPPPMAKAIPKEQPKPEPEPPKQEEKPQIEKLKQVVKPAGPKQASEPGDFADSESDDSLPELRLIWDSPEQLLRVAGNLGMRILVVNPKNEPAGELFFQEGLLVKRFDGKVGSFSNRVRTISSQFFGRDVLRQAKEPVKCFWVLVPATVDQAWVSVQKEAIKSEGVKSSQVSCVEARVTPRGAGYELVVTKVIAL